MKNLCLAALLWAVTLPVLAQGTAKDYLSFLPQKDQDSLFATGEVSNIAGTITDLKLWQKSPFGEKILAAFQGIESTIAAEGLFLIDAPSLPRDELDLKIFKSFTSFSSMKGLQVFSVSKQQMETFLYDASRVDPADHKVRLADPDVETVPPNASYTVYEKEEQTGDSYARFALDFDEVNDTFAVAVTNLSDMKYLFFTLVAPGDLHTYFFIVPCQGKLVLYGLTVVKTGHFLGLERAKEKSFYNRLKALVSWFTTNMKTGA